MSDLQEALTKLNDQVPKLPGLLTALTRRSAALRQATEQALEAVEAKRTAAAQILQAVQQSLAATEADAQAQEARVESAATDLRTKLDEFSQHLTAAEQELSGASGSVDEAVDTLQARLGDATTAAGEAETQVRTAMDGVTQAVRTEGEELRTAAEAARAEVDALGAAVDAARGAAAQSLGDFGARIKQFVDDATARLDQARTTAGTQEGEHTTHVEGASSGLHDGSELQRTEFKRRIKEDLRDKVQTGVDDAVKALEDLAELAGRHEESLRAAREAQEQLWQGLTQKMAPLPEAVESVKDAAQSVGLNFQ